MFVSCEGEAVPLLQTHTITINSNRTTTDHIFEKPLKRVVSVELVSAIVPKGDYRINSHNNKIVVTVTDAEGCQCPYAIFVEPGAYEDIVSLLMEINQLFYDKNVAIVFYFDQLKRKVVACIDSNSVSTVHVDFREGQSTMGDVLGFLPKMYTFLPERMEEGTTASSLVFHAFDALKVSKMIINNKFSTSYTFTNFGGPEATSFACVTADHRVCLKHQLYVDIIANNVTYWDGSHLLERVFIPEHEEEVEYRRLYPLDRVLNQKTVNLDRLSISLQHALPGGHTHPYNLHGLYYSLKIEVKTLNNIL